MPEHHYQLLCKADYHQGSELLPAESRGRQCVVICQMFVMRVSLFGYSSIQKEDLHMLMEAGSDVYCRIQSAVHESGLVCPSELPTHFYAHERYLHVKLKAVYSGFLDGSTQIDNCNIFSLEFAFGFAQSNAVGVCSNFIITFQGQAIAIYYDGDNYIVFDSHSRNDMGLMCSNGTCVLGKIASLNELTDFFRQFLSPVHCHTNCDVQFDLHLYEVSVIQKPRVSVITVPSLLPLDMMIAVAVKNRPTCKATEVATNNRPTCIWEIFHLFVSVGPDYICSCCTQTFFKHSVSKVNRDQMNKSFLKYLSGHISYSGLEWICKGCLLSLREEKTPTFWLHNGLRFPVKPDVLHLTDLEARLVSPRLPFMQLRELPRGGQISLKGNVVNVPADVNNTMKSLPRLLDDDETIMLKLKRKLSYKHHVAFENIRPNRVFNAAHWLVKNSELYRNEGITVNERWLEQLRERTNLDTYSEEHSTQELSDSWSEDEICDRPSFGNFDTVMQPADYREFNQVLSVAPGEGNTPLGLFQDFHSEILSFPTIFCGQQRCDNLQRLVPLHYSSICKWELRHVDRRVAMNIPNIFFKLKRLQIKQVKDKVTLAIRKCKTKGATFTAADILSPGFVETVTQQDEGFRVLRTIRGSPPYWQQAKRDLSAMIRQLGLPTWFCSFSAAETKWYPLLKSLYKLVHHKDLNDDEISDMSWKEKSELIKSDPVTCARYFDFRVQAFIDKVLKNKLHPVGEIADFFYRVEFQQRGSPHIHMMLWISGAPQYGHSTSDEISLFINKYVTCADDEVIPVLVNYQTHRHAKTCRKKDKSTCRFNFPLPPMPRTVVLEPLNTSVDKSKYISIYEKIMKAINCSQGKTKAASFSEFLDDLQLSEDEYILSIRSSLKNSKVFLKRTPQETRINNYNTTLLRSWEANMDIQYILDPYACVSYIVSYISKGQRGLSNLLQSACEEARQESSDIRQQVRRIGNQFLTNVEVGAQEAVYLVLQMPLRRCSRKVLFVNTFPEEKRTVLLKSMSDLKQMPGTSRNVEMDNVLSRYKRRPKILENLCYADFNAWYEKTTYKKRKKHNNDNCFENELEETEYDINHDDDIPLVDETDGFDASCDEVRYKDGTVLRKRKTCKVICTHVPSLNSDKEEYYRTQIMLYTSWRDEINDLKHGFPTYELCFNELQAEISSKKYMFEIISNEMIEVDHSDTDVFEQVNAEAQYQEMIDLEQGVSVSQSLGCFEPGQCTNICPETYDIGQDLGLNRKHLVSNVLPCKEIDNETYLSHVTSLNTRQKVFFYDVLYHFKTQSSPTYLFLSGGAGVGKSVVLRALHQGLLKYFNHDKDERPDTTKILLCAPTGKAAHNIGGNTIHSAFCIPVGRGFAFKPLDMQQLNTMQSRFHDLKLLLIDEISMVGRNMFNFINLRLQEIMGTTRPFGGVSVIAFGDLFQLKPVMDAWVFSDKYNTTSLNCISSNLWREMFSLFELTDIMRQKEDLLFAELLNRLREGLMTENDMATLSSRCISKSTDLDVKYIPHLFCTRELAVCHNESVLSSLPVSERIEIDAIDNVSGDFNLNLQAKILSHVPSDSHQTMGLSKTLKLGLEVPAEVCLNIDTEDGLTNGAACTVKKFDYRVEGSRRCSIVWVQFDDEKIGKLWKMKYQHLFNNGISKAWVPILETTRKFPLQYYQTYLIVRRQFPLQMAAAKTIHKAQGATLKSAVLHFGTRKTDHIHYVGLSRVINLTGVHILTLNEKKISVSEDVQMEMDRLRTNKPFRLMLPDLGSPLWKECIKICCHNCRSLKKHFSAICCEHNMLKADMIAFLETRVSTKRSAYDIEGFCNFTANANESKHGLSVYYKDPSLHFKAATICGIEIAYTEVNREYVVCFLYCPPHSSSISNYKTFMKMVKCTLPGNMKTVLIGDFNVNEFTSKSLSLHLHTVHGFSQLIKTRTTDYNSCLDHIYVNFEEKYISSFGTLESYFSDHKPLHLVLS